MFVCCECCVLSGRGLCDGLITRPGESYRLWRVFVCDQETSKTRNIKPATGLWKMGCNARKTNNKLKEWFRVQEILVEICDREVANSNDKCSVEVRKAD